MRVSTIIMGASALIVANPAWAQDDTSPPEPITISGSVGIYSDYRLRGVSQTDEDAAVQGSITITHESGFYIGTFASNLAGWGTFGGANLELDAIGGYSHTFGPAKVDGGVTWYTYPGGFSESDVVELFGKLSGTIGPLSLTAGVNYAPKQTSLGRFYPNAAAAAAGTPVTPRRNDNLYLSGDASGGIPNIPINLRAHIGYSKGNSGLGPNGTSLSPTGEYFDWALGADYNFYKNLTISATYIDTDIGNGESLYLAPNLRNTRDLSPIYGATALFSLTASF